MDLASGYSDSINYGNGYTPLATGAINNNNAEYQRNQMAMALMAQQAQNNVFASGGGFGAQTAAYAGAGADYGRAVGGGGNIYAPSGGGGGYDDGAGLNPSTAPNGGYYSTPAGQAFLSSYGQGGIGSDRGQSPNQPGNAPIPSFWQGVRDWTGMTSGAPSYEAPAPTPQAYGPGYFDNTFGSAYANQQKAINSKPVDWDKTFSTITAPYAPQTYSGGGIGGESARDPYQDWLKNSAASQGYGALPPFWQGLRDMVGMGQPGGGGYDPYAGLGNRGQPGVTDPMGYGTGGYQGNAIPDQAQQNRAPVQGGMTDPFWQNIRDMMGADPKDQSRLPQGGAYPGATNPNYQPGGMAPQLPYQSWLNAS